MKRTFSLADIRKKPKFSVSKKEDRTLDGIVFDSKGEAKRYAELKLAEQAGLIADLIRQPEFPVKIENHHFCTYTADFKYFDVLLDHQVIEDVKSSGTAKDAAYRLRKKAAELYYGIRITPFLTDKRPRVIKKKRPQ